MACEVCRLRYVVGNDLDSDAKPHVCTTCGKSFSLKIQLKRHVLTHAGGAPYVCNSCEKKSTNLNTMASYAKKSDKKSFECDVCGEEFSLKRSLKKHYLIHTSSDVHPCEICDEDFPTEALLDEHYFVHESRREKAVKQRKTFGPTAKLHVCKVCYKAYVTKASYEKHCETHEPEYASEDEKKSRTKSKPKLNSKRKRSCRSDINYSEDLDSVSENESSGKRKKHTCEVCGCSFSRKSALDGHALVHLEKLDEGENEDFSDTDNAKEEELKAPKCDSFLCNVCGASFTSKGKLKKHRRSHENENPVVSEKQDINQNSSKLEKIVLKRKKDKKFTCKACNKGFVVENCYKKHLLSKHGHSKSSDKQDGSKTDDVGSSNEQASSVEDPNDEEDFVPKKRRGRKKSLPKVDFICEFCNEDFSARRGVFARHRLSHTPEVCGICDERFVDRESLREHCKSHIGTEEAKRFLECSQKHFSVKKSVTATPEPKTEYIYLVIR